MLILPVLAGGKLMLPDDVLEHLGVAAGGELRADKLPDGRIELRSTQKSGRISDAFGILHRENGPKLTIEEINEAIAKGWAGER